jgi:O-acetyl-ADP-ribose deacetylase (regulator of RNase III)
VIRVVRGDLATLSVQGVVRAVRSDLAPVDAGARDLVHAAGAALEERLSRIGVLPVGGAVLTPAGALTASYLIHIVVMSDEEPQTHHSIQRALRTGLRRASDWGLDSLGVPALGLGAGSIEPEESARALVDILFNHLDEGLPPLDLAIAVGSEFEEMLFSKLVGDAGRARSAIRN